MHFHKPSILKILPITLKQQNVFNKDFAKHLLWLIERNIIHLSQAALKFRFRTLVISSSSQEA